MCRYHGAPRATAAAAAAAAVAAAAASVQRRCTQLIARSSTRTPPPPPPPPPPSSLYRRLSSFQQAAIPRRRLNFSAPAVSDTAIHPSVCPSPRRAAASSYRHAGCLQLSYVRTADTPADGRAVYPPRVELPSAGAYRLTALGAITCYRPFQRARYCDRSCPSVCFHSIFQTN